MTLSRLPEPDEEVLSQRNAIIKDLEQLVGAETVISDEEGRRVFEADALTAYRRVPLAVVLPRSTQEVVKVLKYCHKHEINVVPRGAGTSLCGGALPSEDAIVIGVSKMNCILDVDFDNRTMRVEFGHHQSGDFGSRRGGRFLLCARPIEPARVHACWKSRDELRWSSLSEVRRHDQQRFGYAHRFD